MNLVDYVVLPKELTDFERRYLARVNRIALWFFAAHVPLFTAIAWFNDTHPLLALALTAAVMTGPLLATKTVRNPRTISVVFGVTAMAMGGLLVNFGRGPMTIEMHFYFFVLLALLSVFGNPMPIVAAAVTVVLHHALLWALFPEAVFNYDAPFWAVALHGTFVIMESVAACFVARSFFDNVIGLERIVQARTAALDLRNREMSLILDNVGQGFLTLDRSAAVPSERSAILRTWFGEPKPGETLHGWVSGVDASVGAWLEVGWDSVFDDVLPTELAIDQLPKRILAKERHLEFEYRPILQGATLEKLLVVISDVSQRVERDAAEVAQSEILAVFERVVADRAGFLGFLEEAARLVLAIGDSSQALTERLRALHTLKGNLGIYGITGLAAYCHQVESAVQEGEDGLSAEACAGVAQRWQAFLGRLSGILGSGSEDMLQVARSEYDGIRSALRDGQLDNAQLLRRLDRWMREPVEGRLQHLGEQAKGLAKRLGKGDIEVSVSAPSVRTSGQHWAPFWSAMVHVIRNSVDHGFPSEGEPAQGSPLRLELSAEERDGAIVVTVRDNGRGVDWVAVKSKAQSLGLPSATPADLELALYADGLSTKQEATELSGRGVGMAAVLHECQALGGRVTLESGTGTGTTFRFIVPDRPTLRPQAA